MAGGQTEGAVARKRNTPEEIVGKLRQVEVLIGRGKPVAEPIRATGVSSQRITAGEPGMAG